MHPVPGPAGIILTGEEIEILSKICQQGAIPDDAMGKEPYAFFIRQGLISHEISNRFPSPPSVDGFISLPRNALAITDLGRQVLRESEQRRQEAAQKHSDKRRQEKAALRNTVVGAVIGSLFTLIIEHLDEIFDGLIGIIQTFFKIS